MWMVETRGLSKSYGRIASLVDCNLQIHAGCIFGLLGPNGAGKSTLIRTLLGFLKPTQGTAAIAGYCIAKQSLLARQQVSYLPGDARLYRSFRGRDLLELFSGLHPHGSLQHALAIAQRLELELSRRVMFMSTGMRQKLAISIVLGCQAPLLVLDEPTANLDPNVRAEVIALINETRRQGRTVFFSSHIFSDIDETCDRVAILRDGRVVAEQDIKQLGQMHIVTAELSTAWSGPFVYPDFVAYADIEQHARDTNLPAAAGKRIELHLSGSPNIWMAWLEQLQLKDLLIERAGIRAIYQRHHRTAAVFSHKSDDQPVPLGTQSP